MSIKAPCKGCESRSAACWDKCEKYQEWKRQREAARDRDQALNEFISYCKDRKIKRERRFGK